MFRRPPRNIVQVKTVLETSQKGPRARRSTRRHFFRMFRRKPNTTPAQEPRRGRLARRERKVTVREAAPKLRRAAWGLAIAILLILGLTVWRHLHVRRNAPLLLRSAAAAEARSDWASVAAYLAEYLQDAPRDTDALERYADALHKSANTEEELAEVQRLYHEVLEHEPGRVHALLQLAELQLRDSPETAIGTAQRALAIDPTFKSARRLLAAALDEKMKVHGETIADVLAVVDAYGHVVADDRTDTKSALRLASLLREHPNEIAAAEKVAPEEIEFRADAIINDHVRHNDQNPDAYLARFEYRSRIPSGPSFRTSPLSTSPGRRFELDRDLLTATELAPERIEIRLAALSTLFDLDLNSLLLGPAPTIPLTQESLALGLEQVQAAQAANTVPSDDIHLGLAKAQLFWASADPKQSVVELKACAAAHPDNLVVACRLVEAYLETQYWEDADAALQSLASRGERQSAPGAKDDFPVVAKLLRTFWLAAPDNPGGDRSAAATLLADAEKQVHVNRLASNTALELARCHTILGQWDQVANAYRRAVAVDDSGYRARNALANALRAQGALTDAAQEYQQILRSKSLRIRPLDRDSLWHNLASTELLLQLRLPAKQRSWQAYELVIARYRQEMPRSVSQLTIELEGLQAQQPANGRAEILQRLREAEVLLSRDPQYWLLAHRFALPLEEFALADEAVTEIEKLSQTVRNDLREQNRQSQQRTHAKSSPHENPAAVDANAASPERDTAFYSTAEPAEDQASPISSLEEADRRQSRIRQAALAGDKPTLIRIAHELRQEEGADGYLADFADIRGLLLDGRQGDLSALRAAERSAHRYLAKHPTQPLAHLARAMVAETQGNEDAAIDGYRQAIDLGQRDLYATRRLLRLLLLANRTKEAQEHLQTLPKSAQSAANLLPLSVAILLQERSIDEALRLCDAALSSRPEDAEAHVLRGSVWLRSGNGANRKRALESLEQAVRLEPQNVQCWIAMLAAAAAEPKPDRLVVCTKAVRAILTLLADPQGHLSPAAESWIVARSLEVAGDLTAAERYYRLALSRGIRESSHGRLCCPVFVTDRATRGTAALAGIDAASLPPTIRQIHWVFQIAQVRNGSTSVATQLKQEDSGLWCIAKIVQGGPEVRQEVFSHRDSIPAAKLPADQHRLFAIQSWLQGDAESLAEHLRAGLQGEITSEPLANATAMLLIADSSAEATHWLGALASQSSGLTSLPKLELAALTAVKEVPLADAVHRYVFTANTLPIDQQRSDQQRLEHGCKLLSARGNHELAIALARTALAKDVLSARLTLAKLLATSAQGNTEAVGILTSPGPAAELVPSAIASCEILNANGLDSAGADRLLERIAMARKTAPDPDLFAAILKYRIPCDDDVLAASRDALEQAPGHHELRVQLALRLAENPQTIDQAANLLDEGITLFGPTIELRIACGELSLARGQPAAAIRHFEAALAEDPLESAAYDHLAKAYQAAGHQDSSQVLRQYGQRAAAIGY